MGLIGDDPFSGADLKERVRGTIYKWFIASAPKRIDVAHVASVLYTRASYLQNQ